MPLLKWAANLTAEGQKLHQIWAWKYIVLSYCLALLGSITGGRCLVDAVIFFASERAQG
jgi:hypothetical protein